MPLVIYNPKSRNGKPEKKMRQFLHREMKDEKDVRVIDITTEEDIKKVLKAHPKEDPVYLLGGDGTLNHFINQTFELHPLAFPVTLVPLGSGNDFYRTLKKDPAKAQSIYQVTTPFSTRYFLNGMGIGIDGEIGLHVNASPRKKRSTYFFETIKALIRYQPQTVEVTLDEHPYTFDRTYIVVASNGQYFGSGMRISPDASFADDALDVIIVHSISRLKILMIFLSIYVGKHLAFKKHVFHAQAKKITIQQPTPGVLQTDGETWPDQTTLTVQITDKKTAFRI